MIQDKKIKCNYNTNRKSLLSKILKSKETLQIPKFYEENVQLKKFGAIVDFEEDRSLEKCKNVAKSYYYDPNSDNEIDPIIHTLKRFYLKIRT